MFHGGIIVVAAVLLSVVLLAEKRENRALLVPSKGALSVLFVLTSVMVARVFSTYQALLLAGLAFCLAGDVFLALPQRTMFLLGLISFLIGHGFYVGAFLVVGSAGTWTLGGALVFCGLSAGVYRWLSPHLGRMRGPVSVYILVITAMVACACSVFERASLPREARFLILAGAVLFYVSDLFVARDRFLKKEFLNRLAGLPTYYCAQFLLAFSTAFI
jgi:uncharacterized membrane protein YhhN